MSSNTKGLSATDVNGGSLSRKGVVNMLVLVGDGGRKRVSFIVCELPPGKEPLLNVETSMALGALPQQFPNWDFTTGKKYEDQDIIHIFGGPDAFEKEEKGEEEGETGERVGIQGAIRFVGGELHGHATIKNQVQDAKGQGGVEEGEEDHLH